MAPSHGARMSVVPRLPLFLLPPILGIAPRPLASAIIATRHNTEAFSLLQAQQSLTQATSHTHGVTPDFFDESVAGSLPSFEPSAPVPRSLSAIQIGPASSSENIPRPHPVDAQHIRHSMELLPSANLTSSSASALHLQEAASTARRIFSLVSEGAHAAAQNVASSWSFTAGASPKAFLPPVGSQAGIASNRNSDNAGTPGAIGFFSNAKRTAEGEQPLSVLVAATRVQSAPFPQHHHLALNQADAARPEERVVRQADFEKTEQLRRMEAAEALEREQQERLEGKMNSIRWGA